MRRVSPWLWAGLAGAALLYLWSRSQSGAASITQAVQTGVTNVSAFFDNFKNLIAQFEGLSLTPYQDSAGKWTIGYGHLIIPGDPYYPQGSLTSITQADADALLAADTQAAQDCVDQSVTVALTDNQRAALVSLVFNIGCGAFQASTLLALLNQADYAGAAAQFDVWNHVTDPASGQLVVSAGLTTRRASETALFMA